VEEDHAPRNAPSGSNTSLSQQPIGNPAAPLGDEVMGVKRHHSAQPPLRKEATTSGSLNTGVLQGARSIEKSFHGVASKSLNVSVTPRRLLWDDAPAESPEIVPSMPLKSQREALQRASAMSPERGPRGAIESSRDVGGHQRSRPVLKWAPAITECKIPEGGATTASKSPMRGRRLGEKL
jgi:hypothetical protein